MIGGDPGALWYRTWAAAAAVGIAGGLAFAARPLVLLDPGCSAAIQRHFQWLVGSNEGGCLAATNRTLFTETGERFGFSLSRASYDVAAIQWITILLLGVAAVFFVWENAPVFGRKVDRMRVMLEAGVFLCAFVASLYCTETVWGFRIVFGLGAAFWLGRSVMDGGIEPFRTTLRQYLALFGLFWVVVVPIVALAGGDRRLLADVAFTYAPFAAAFWGFFVRTIFWPYVEAKWQ